MGKRIAREEQSETAGSAAAAPPSRRPGHSRTIWTDVREPFLQVGICAAEPQGELHMSPNRTAYGYRQRADHCLEIARVLEHVRHRKLVLDMAEEWLRLAEQAEKSRNPFAQYQATPRREPPRADSQSTKRVG